MKKSIILILSISLLLQFTTALPFAKRETGDVAVAPAAETTDKAASSSESSEENLSPREHLLLGVVIQLSLVAKYAVDDGTDLLKNTIKELNTLPDKSVELQANITRMDEFVKGHEDINLAENEGSLVKLFQMMQALCELLQSYEHMTEDSKLKEQLKQALNKNGYEKFKAVLEKEVKEFINDFTEGFQGYLGMISEAEKEKNAKAIEWFNKFKAEKDDEEQIKMFGGFFAAMEI